MNEHKLIIIIPAYNEQATVASAVRSIPKAMPGISSVEVLVIDDGSIDATIAEATGVGVAQVISLGAHRGLAVAFSRGLEEAISRGADYIVNFDADGQYSASEIQRLIEPLQKGQADIVIGNRQVRKLSFMPVSKRYGNMFGSWVVRKLSGLPITDASSGFRSYSREGALRLNTFAQHTYTHESILDAASKGLRVVEVPCSFSPTNRPDGASRLIVSLGKHIRASGFVILRTFVVYKPLLAFLTTGVLFIAGGAAIGIRFLYYFFQGQGSGKIQSLILAAVLAIVGFQVMVMGFLAHATAVNRRIVEELLYRSKVASIQKERS